MCMTPYSPSALLDSLKGSTSTPLIGCPTELHLQQSDICAATLGPASDNPYTLSIGI